MLLALLIACNPLRAVADDEAIWWGPADRIEAERGIDLVELPAGEPVGYWPRIVVYADRIEVDNRAWLLSLPDEVLNALEPDEVEALLMEPSRIVAVEQGQVAEDDKRGQLISPLYAALLELAEEHKDLASRTRDEALELRGNILVVPDASTTTSLLREVLFTAGQAQYGYAGIAGVAQGRVRMASAFDSRSCAIELYLTVGADGATLQAAGALLRGESCASAPSEVPALALGITDACAERFDAIATTVAERHPDVTPIDPSEWRCAVVHMILTDHSEPTTVADLLPAVALLHPLHPKVGQGFFVSGIGPSRPVPCDARVRIEDLTETQLDAACNLARAQDNLAAATEAVALGQPDMRWNRRRGALLARPRDEDELASLRDALTRASSLLGDIDEGLQPLPSKQWFVEKVSATTPEGFADDAAAATLRRYGGQLTYCLEQRRDEASKDAGPVAFQGTIVVVDQRVISHAIAFPSDAAVQDCANAKVQRWRFPPDVTGPRDIEVTARWGMKE